MDVHVKPEPLLDRMGRIQGLGFCEPRPGIRAVRDDETLYCLSESLDANAVWVACKELPEADTADVVIGAPGEPETAQRKIDRGVVALSLRNALARLAGLPRGWRQAQDALIDDALRPLQGAVPIRMEADAQRAAGDTAGPSRHPDAARFVTEWLDAASDPQGRGVMLLQAEAGKGKSTLLANLSRVRLGTGQRMPLLYVPLRRLPSSQGISWNDVAQHLLGVVASDAGRLAESVRAGVVALALDGLDEIGGRYDPSTLRQLVEAVTQQLQGSESRIVFSGRRTQAKDLADCADWNVTLDLPETQSDDFREYVEAVVPSAIEQWRGTIYSLPEDLYKRLEISDDVDSDPSEAQCRQVVDWVAAVFDEFGKDRSLFFVQALAALGRTEQVRRILYNPPHIYRPSELNVCLVAAAMAFDREQGKIEETYKESYTIESQLRALAAMAVLAAAPPTMRLRTANDLVAEFFGITSPATETEKLTAIVRQNQKHALLFASVADGDIRGGDWRPGFLSPWLRDALLVWALRAARGAFTKDTDLPLAVAAADDARLAFSVLLSQMDDTQALHGVAAAFGHPTASPSQTANHWTLWASSPDLHYVLPEPPILAEMADLGEREFSNCRFGGIFGGASLIFYGARFEDCTFEDVRFDNCDFTNVTFVDCAFTKVIFEGCDGPTIFENCTFQEAAVINPRSASSPALRFSGCSFGDACEVSINEHPYPRRSALRGDPLRFDECEAKLPDILVASVYARRPRLYPGVARIGTEQEDPVQRTLMRMLRYFFPPAIGDASDNRLNARAYIRLSALGRGALPENAPQQGSMKQILESVGFADGGRADHLYAPWSSVLGQSEQGRALRDECTAFLRDRSSRGPRIEQMLSKLRAEMG